MNTLPKEVISEVKLTINRIISVKETYRWISWTFLNYIIHSNIYWNIRNYSSKCHAVFWNKKIYNNSNVHDIVCNSSIRVPRSRAKTFGLYKVFRKKISSNINSKCCRRWIHPPLDVSIKILKTSSSPLSSQTLYANSSTSSRITLHFRATSSEEHPLKITRSHYKSISLSNCYLH